MSRIGLALLLVAIGLAQPVAAADPGRGQALYESRCGGCHNTSVHQRDSRRAVSFAGVLAQVSRWNASLGGDWTAEDIEDVAAYLNQRYYKHSCPDSVCPPGRASAMPPGTLAAR
jgi:mono/diheme cytochrome c family protein